MTSLKQIGFLRTCKSSDTLIPTTALCLDLHTSLHSWDTVKIWNTLATTTDPALNLWSKLLKIKNTPIKALIKNQIISISVYYSKCPSTRYSSEIISRAKILPMQFLLLCHIHSQIGNIIWGTISFCVNIHLVVYQIRRWLVR